MNRLIRNLALGILITSSIGGQAALGADDDLNTYVYNHLENWDTEFQIDYYKSDVLDLVKEAAKKDDYLSLSLSKLVYERSGKTASIEVTYKTTKEQEEYINEELTKIVKTIITESVSDFEKVKAINDYLVNRYEYDDTYVSNNAYSALTTGKTTCQGYALTTCRMLSLAGVENKIVIGDLDGVPHGWNLVKINEKWYHLDVTNDDALGNYKYFLRKDSVLLNDGFTWNSDDYPKCDEDYNEISNQDKITNITNKTTLSNNTQLNDYSQSTSGYRSNSDGNWYFNNNAWYFLKGNGNYVVGWNLIDNKWYYMNGDGVMCTGWVYSNGKWYYCDPQNGAMVVNTVINGYKIDSNGVWIS